MRPLKILTIFLSVAALLVNSSCKKQNEGPASFDFALEVSEIGSISAELNIDGKGEAPSLVRYLAPVLKSEFDAAIDTSDEDAVKKFISENGTAVSLPYFTYLKGLNISTEYVVGVVAFDEDMNIYSYKTHSFSTTEMDDRVVGNPSGAGELTENIL